MAKKRGKPHKVYTTGGRSSYNAGFNLGKGQLDKLVDGKISTTTLPLSEKLEVENDIMSWGYEYWEGIFRLGKNTSKELVKIFPLLRYNLVRNGEVVVIRKIVEEKEYFLLADILVNDKIKQVKRNLGGDIVELKVIYHSKKDLVGNLVDEISKGNESDFTADDFVIFYNTSQGLPELRRGKQKINHIVKIEEHFLKDLAVSRPRIMAYHPLITNKNKAEMLKQYIFEEANDLITIASLNEGDKPTLHNWEGNSKQNDLWQNYIKAFTEWKRLNGIRTNTARKSKENRAAEIELVEEQFETIENSRYNSMAEALEECVEKWQWQYKLLKPDEVETDEETNTINQLEKQLRIEELKKQIKELKQENSTTENKQTPQSAPAPKLSHSLKTTQNEH